MKRNIPFIMLLVLLLMVAVFAGTTGKIAGTVVDRSTKEPLIGVNIFLEETVYGATTDLEGSYIMLNIPPGRYTMIVQYLGYQEVRMEGVQISIDRTTRLDFDLIESALELDEVIVVQGERDFIQRDRTSSQSTVSAEQIQSLPVVGLSDILQLQAGVTRGAGGDFHIRGGRSSEISYWVNGISVTDAYDNSRAIEIDNNSIQELQVISGTFNAEYGNAMSGIINAVTKEGDRRYNGNIQIFSGDYFSDFTSYFYNIDDFNPAANYSFRGTLSGPVPLTGKRITFFATGRYNYDDGYLYGNRKFSSTGDTLVSKLGSSQFAEGDVVAMNWNETLTSQFKLTYRPIPTIKLNAELLYSSSEYQDYDHAFKFAPDGNLNRFATSYNGWFAFNHTLSPTTYYTINLAYLDKSYKHYLYKNQLDPRYQDPDLLVTFDDVSFRTGGTNNNQFNRQTLTYSLKGDLTSQVSKGHLLKIGFEGRQHQVNFDSYNIQNATPNDTVFTPLIPNPMDATRSKYTREPIEFAAYMQDKIEYDDVIINIGFRLDYFDPKAQIPSNFADPNLLNPLSPEYQELPMEEREAVMRTKAKAKWQLSPRFGIAYPISASGVIHFSYGHFLQIPSLEYLYNRSDYILPSNPNLEGIFGNPDLDAQKTIMYEIGLQQEIFTDFKIDITGYYRDVRDWITAGPPIRTRNNGTYVRYINKDYANIKGITLAMQKRYSNNYSFDMSYTFQIAEGSNSTPEQEFFQLNANSEPTISILPLDWDQRHLVNASFYYGMDNWGSSLIARTGTGLPYTPSITQFTADRGIRAGLQRNSRVRPTQFTLDLRLHYDLKLWEQKFVLFMRVFNLLDNRVATNVFGDTGRPDFTTAFESKNEIEDQRPNLKSEFTRFPWHYAPPRSIQFGLEWSF